MENNLELREDTRGYTRKSTSVNLLNYHFVFCPRYRRKLFLNEDFDQRFKELVGLICDRYEFRLIAMEIDVDHCHLFLNVLPAFSTADVMAKIKGGTSKILRDEFAELSQMPSLWTRSYFVATAGTVSIDAIKHYVESQRKRS
jgi:putative transposase